MAQVPRTLHEHGESGGKAKVFMLLPQHGRHGEALGSHCRLPLLPLGVTQQMKTLLCISLPFEQISKSSLIKKDLKIVFP